MKPPVTVLWLALLGLLLGVPSAARADDPDAPAKPRDLGPPLVDNAKDLKQLGKYAAWLDPKNKQVVLVGETCKAGYGLEFLITNRDRGYESVLIIDAPRPANNEPSVFAQVQAMLLLLGAKSGHPAYYKNEKTTLATGDEIAIEVRWKDKDGKTQSADARTLIRDMKTKKTVLDMKTEKGASVNWVFAGSRMVTIEGQNHFMGDSGDFVCVLNNPSALLDLPVQSASAIEDRSFEANSDIMPPPETPVTIILKPIPKAKAGAEVPPQKK